MKLTQSDIAKRAMRAEKHYAQYVALHREIAYRSAPSKRQARAIGSGTGRQDLRTGRVMSEVHLETVFNTRH